MDVCSLTCVIALQKTSVLQESAKKPSSRGYKGAEDCDLLVLKELGMETRPEQ